MTVFDYIKLAVGAAAATFGTLAAADGLPASWHKGVMIGLAVTTAITATLTKAVGSKPDAK